MTFCNKNFIHLCKAFFFHSQLEEICPAEDALSWHMTLPASTASVS